MANSILVTGATGFIGSHFLHKLGHAYGNIFCLLRQTKENSFERLAKSLSTAANSYLKSQVTCANIFPISGNLETQHCGVSDDDLALMSHHQVNETWHFASTVQYEDEKQNEISSINIEGTKNLIELSRRLGARRFIYVSTAYSCGGQTGNIEEKIYSPANFNNEYERSKNHAEHCLRDHCGRHGIEWVILRPSIVVGPSESKKTGGSSTGLYGFIREIYRAKKILPPSQSALRIKGDPNAQLNVIAIDEFMEAIGDIVRNGMIDQSIHHITSDIDLSVQHCLDLITEALGTKAIVLDSEMKEPWSREETIINKRIDFYKSYLSNEKAFIRTSNKIIGVGDASVAGFIEECVRELTTPSKIGNVPPQNFKSINAGAVALPVDG